MFGSNHYDAGFQTDGERINWGVDDVRKLVRIEGSYTVANWPLNY
ncbi:hypothetical protein CLV88_103122 [Shimia abyssi]|uniref:Uncharacterized protein n=1 Tax=Shimia abyssi TaxID=1662395 RepID=A0A2P8FFI2_9RHOB|nr:hypothetical protein CLV88_103122 [Shimia abyssi]